MTLGDKTTVSVSVDVKAFAGSVHGSLGCGGCHGGVPGQSSLGAVCHQTHAIKKGLPGKAGAGNVQYCLACHSKELTRSISGERLSLTLDESWISGSVHRNHDCTDCHTAYTRQFHPAPRKGALLGHL